MQSPICTPIDLLLLTSVCEAWGGLGFDLRSAPPPIACSRSLSVADLPFEQLPHLLHLRSLLGSVCTPIDSSSCLAHWVWGIMVANLV